MSAIERDDLAPSVPDPSASDSGVENAEQQAQVPKPSGRLGLCVQCGLEPSKYRCPGCSTPTCSLPCSTKHKQDSGCTGKRDRTSFVDIKELNDRHMISDYRFLEECVALSESGKRLKAGGEDAAEGGRFGAHCYEGMTRIWKEAWRHRTNVVFQPPGMKRHSQNTSIYDRRRRRIMWRIEWVFKSADVELFTMRVDELHTLHQALARLLGTTDPTASQEPPTSSQPRDLAPAARDSAASRAVERPAAQGEQAVATRAGSEQGRGRQQAEEGGGTGRPAGAPPPPDPALQHELRHHLAAGLPNLPLLLKAQPRPANQEEYFLLDGTQSIQSQLANRLIIEFPTILVLLPTELAAYTIVQDPPPQLPQGAAQTTSEATNPS